MKEIKVRNNLYISAKNIWTMNEINVRNNLDISAKKQNRQRKKHQYILAKKKKSILQEVFGECQSP